MSDFSGRLKEERKRLGKTQTEWGEICGVGANAQLLYEKGKRTPDSDYLLKGIEAGMDVMYLLTGERTAGLLSTDEQELVSLFRQASLAIKMAAIAALHGGINATTRQDVLIEGDVVGQVARGNITNEKSVIFKKPKG